MAPVEKTPKNAPQPPPVPKLSGQKAALQVIGLVLGPAIIMYVLSLVWK